MKNVSAGLVVALLLALVVGVGLIQAFANFTGGIELRPAAPALLLPSTMSVGAPKTVDSGTNTFEVDVNIADADNLGAYEYDLGFDDAILSVNSVSHADTILDDTGRDVIELGPLTGTPGVVSVGAATCPVSDCSATPSGVPAPIPGVTGAGTLSTIKFDAPGRGVTDLTLSNAQITDVNANVQGLEVAGVTLGIVPFTLVRSPSAQRYNAISVSAAETGLNTADAVAQYIDGDVQEVLKWVVSPTFQGWVSWYPQLNDGDNFAVTPGMPLMVLLDPGADANLLIVGKAPTAVSFPLVKGPVGGACKYNFISLPLDRTDITNAQDLADSIGPQGVQEVLRWVPSDSSQVWESWYPELQDGTNFPTFVGEPYMVCIDERVTRTSWP